MSGKNKPGPDQWKPNIAEVRKLSTLACTYTEIAAYFDVSESLINKEVARNPEFKEAIEFGKAKGRMSIRRKQYELAMAGDKTMLIWLGKQLLGQSQNGTEAEGESNADPLAEFRPKGNLIPMSKISGG